MAETLLATLLGVGFLHAFYRAVRVQWPSSYFSLDSSFGYAITSRPTRYVAFRFMPLFFVALFVSVTLDRLGGSPLLSMLGITVVHIALTSVKASIELVRADTSPRRGPLLVLHSLVAIGSALAGLAAFLARNTLSSFVPDVEELSASLWTGVFAGVAGVYLLHLSQHDGDSTHPTLQKSKEKVGERLWEVAGDVAVEQSADPALVRAIMLVENAQRPSWFRRLERVKGLVFREGTYGIMQVRSSSPITDEESIRRSVTERLAGVMVPTREDYGEQYPDYDALRAIAVTYNGNTAYTDDVVTAYDLASRKS